MILLSLLLFVHFFQSVFFQSVFSFVHFFKRLYYYVHVCVCFFMIVCVGTWPERFHCTVQGQKTEHANSQQRNRQRNIRERNLLWEQPTSKRTSFYFFLKRFKSEHSFSSLVFCLAAYSNKPSSSGFRRVRFKVYQL